MKNTALITGASSGIGLQVARQLANSHHVIMVSRTRANLERAESEVKSKSGSVLLKACDVCSEWEMADLVADYRPHLVIHAAGIISLSAFENAEKDAVSGILFTNIAGTLNLLKALARNPRATQVGILNSISALFPAPHPYATYGASKAGQAMLCETLRPELQSIGIRLTIGYFGFVQTPMISSERATDNRSRAILEKMLGVFPPHRAEYAAQVIIRDTLAGKKESYLSSGHRILAVFARAMPRTFSAVVRWRAGI